MAYKVVAHFIDIQDKNHVYEIGDQYPHDGRKVDDKRVRELSTSANMRRMPLIEESKVEAEKPKKKQKKEVDE